MLTRSMEVKELTIEDMKYVDAVIAEEFGHHAMIYNPEDKFCWLASPIELPYEQGELIAAGLWGEENYFLLKVKRPNGKIFHVNAVEI